MAYGPNDEDVIDWKTLGDVEEIMTYPMEAWMHLEEEHVGFKKNIPWTAGCKVNGLQ